MDELQMIASLLDEEPSAHGGQDGRRKLTREIASQGARTPRRRLSARPRFALFGGFGLAGAAAAVAGAVLLSSGTTPRAPDRHAAPQSAARLMLAAAESADHEPAQRTGRYWQVQFEESGRLVEEGKLYDFSRRRGYYDAGPNREAWLTERMVSKRFAGTTDEKGARSQQLDTFTWTKAMLAPGTLFRTASGGSTPEGAKVNADMRDLPADPGALKTALKRLLDKQWPGADLTEWLFANAGPILTGPVGPGVRGAVFRLLAEDPELRAEGTVTDPLNRPGTAFSLRSGGGDMVTDDRLIIDTRTGRLLASQSVLAGPSSAWPGKKPGYVMHSSTVRSYGWTDSVPDYPAPKYDGPPLKD
ncbi:CU044_5270 family protein [Actinomadura gamaensis]|uniref:CU044_5270 family protein n=1 Tax=Actinomadura gamaensis TaxID=1763541 RepID=A0ABV9U9C1_9ACTN